MVSLGVFVLGILCGYQCRVDGQRDTARAGRWADQPRV